MPLVFAGISSHAPGITGRAAMADPELKDGFHGAYRAMGEAIRRACDELHERIALVGTGGISHWPATPDSGKINEAWDRAFLDKWARNDREALLGYTDEDTYREAGQGGFEIRTFLSVAAAARGKGEIRHYAPIPIFAVGCTIGVMQVEG